MKRLSICWIIGCLLGLVACRPEVPAQAEQGETDVFPDYREVTVPVNMAPPNFKLVNQQLQGITRLKTMNRELIIAADHGVFNLPETDWKVLSQDAQGKQIDVTVYFREPQSDWKQMSFPIYVSRDSVDAYLVYRRIFPGYRMWNEMGIYKRCVENYVEKSILDNQSTNNSCMNCHAFCERQGEQMLFHQRGSHNGTYLIDHRQVKKIALERDGKPASFVYPYWHPSGRYVAFSTNETHQDFHLSDENRIEVYDVESDVLIYDTEKERYSVRHYWLPWRVMRLFPLLLRMVTICCSVRRILSVCRKIIGMSGITCYESLLIRKTVRLEPKWIPYIMRGKRAGVLSSRESPRMGSGYFIRCPIMAISLFGIRMRICICWICLPGQSILCRK